MSSTIFTAFGALLLLSPTSAIFNSPFFSLRQCDPIEPSSNALTSVFNFFRGLYYQYECEQAIKTNSNLIRFYYMKSGDINYRLYSPDDLGANSMIKNASAVNVLLHGYADGAYIDSNKSWMKQIGALLAEITSERNQDYTVTILVDYESVSNCFYPLLVSEFMPRAAAELRDFFDNLSIDPNKLYLFGHSLGAHILGECGASMMMKPALIIGIDAAGPGFAEMYPYSAGRGLRAWCAQVVKVIHTDNVLGTNDKLGTIDLYMNDRNSKQPGCMTNTCSHVKSVNYFLSMLDPNSEFHCTNDDSLPPNQLEYRLEIFNHFPVNGNYTCITPYKCYPYV